MDYHVWGAMLDGYRNLYTKPNLITDLNEALQVNWDSLPQEPINRAVESFTPWLKTCTKADGEQTENTKWLSSVHCVVSVTLFCCVSAQTFFSARKSLSSRAKISITNIYFTQKFQMVAEKTENDFRGFLFHLLYIPLQVYALMATTKHDYNTEHETVFLHNVHNSLLKLSFMFAEKNHRQWCIIWRATVASSQLCVFIGYFGCETALFYRITGPCINAHTPKCRALRRPQSQAAPGEQGIRLPRYRDAGPSTAARERFFGWVGRNLSKHQSKMPKT